MANNSITDSTPRPLRACPLCLDDLVVRTVGSATSYSCPSCRAVAITVRSRLAEANEAAIGDQVKARPAEALSAPSQRR